MADFNVDLLKYDTNTDNTAFFRINALNFSSPLHFSPNTCDNTPIDSLFSNNIEDGLISGNITTTTSDQYVQFPLKKGKKYSKLIKKYFDTILKNSMMLNLNSN